MSPSVRKVLKRLFTGLLFYSSTCLALSSTPPETAEYAPRDWKNSSSAQEDARYAIKNSDLRLLGFAARGANIPGLSPDQTEVYSKQCGLRFFEDFSDVIRDQSEVNRRKQAAAYARQYNAVILESCKTEK
ncbi:MAG: hypothetical protein RQ982_09095 [Gammaproteobacteria bacterium]|nr:hypothetical protein [Gammaproteobacteria bacterium]